MDKYYNLLGLKLEEVEKILLDQNTKYSVTTISGRKDKEKLIIPRVIKISETEGKLELIVTNFSDSLN